MAGEVKSWAHRQAEVGLHQKTEQKKLGTTDSFFSHTRTIACDRTEPNKERERVCVCVGGGCLRRIREDGGISDSQNKNPNRRCVRIPSCLSGFGVCGEKPQGCEDFACQRGGSESTHCSNGYLHPERNTSLCLLCFHWFLETKPVSLNIS